MKKSGITKDLRAKTREELEQEIVSLTMEPEAANQKASWLEEQFHLHQKQKFGSSSEKTKAADIMQMSFFNEAEAIVDEAGAVEEPTTAKVCPPVRKKRKGKKEKLTASLPKETIEFKLTEEEKICPACGQELVDVKKTVRKELIVIPTQVKVREYIDHVYACRRCQKTGESNPIHNAGAPKALLRNSLASASFVADVMKKKFVDYIPIYRQEQELKRNGIALSRQNLSNWVIRCAEQHLSGIYELMQEELLKKDIIHADETELEVLHEPGREATATSYMWVFRTGKYDSPIVLYRYAPTRSGVIPEEVLGNYSGYLQTDGYAGYNRLTKRAENPATAVGCFAHARRKFCEAHSALSHKEKEIPHPNIDKGIMYCDKIFAIEKELAGLNAEDRQIQRKLQVEPVLEAYFDWVKNFDPKELLKGKFRDAIVYSQNQEKALRGFLLDGGLECSNNIAERSIKPFVISRKNFLFCNTPSGADAAATIFSIVETAKGNNLDPFRYLEHIFTCLSQDEDYDLEMLLPWSEYLPESCKAIIHE